MEFFYNLNGGRPHASCPFVYIKGRMVKSFLECYVLNYLLQINLDFGILKTWLSSRGKPRGTSVRPACINGSAELPEHVFRIVTNLGQLVLTFLHEFHSSHDSMALPTFGCSLCLVAFVRTEVSIFTTSQTCTT